MRGRFIPILILSSASDQDSAVVAFQAGADDYVLKPLRPNELVARLSAPLRRGALL